MTNALLSRPSVAFKDLLWSCPAFHGIVWPYIVLYGLLWPFMATYRFGLVWSFLAVIDPNSFGLVFLTYKAITCSVYRVTSRASVIWKSDHSEEIHYESEEKNIIKRIFLTLQWLK